MGAAGNTWMQAAAGAASSAIGIGIQRLGAKYDRRQQMQTQEGLTDIQKRAEKEMMDYQQQKELEMWEKTGYGAQVKQMNQAGINPALMYGMGGGGGQTTGHGGSPGISGGTAGYVDTTGMGIQKGLELALLASQKNVLDTQAEKNKADAAATSGVQTDVGRQNIEESKARTNTLMQGYDNMRQDYEIRKLEITMKNIENFEKQASQGDRLSYIKSEAKTAINIVDSTAAEAKIDKATINQKIQIIQEEAIGAGLRNLLTRENTFLAKEQSRAIAQGIMRDWDKMNQTERDIRIKEALKDFNTDPNREAIQQATNLINGIMHARPIPQGSTINQSRSKDGTKSRTDIEYNY